jgi:hypothetical protein
LDIPSRSTKEILAKAIAFAQQHHAGTSVILPLQQLVHEFLQWNSDHPACTVEEREVRAMESSILFVQEFDLDSALITPISAMCSTAAGLDPQELGPTEPQERPRATIEAVVPRSTIELIRSRWKGASLTSKGQSWIKVRPPARPSPPLASKLMTALLAALQLPRQEPSTKP